jgi:hypothetical protein
VGKEKPDDVPLRTPWIILSKNKEHCHVEKTIFFTFIVLLLAGCTHSLTSAIEHPHADIAVYVKNKNGEFYFFIYDTPSGIPDVNFYSRKLYQRDWYYWGNESLGQFVDFFSSFIPD